MRACTKKSAQTNSDSKRSCGSRNAFRRRYCRLARRSVSKGSMSRPPLRQRAKSAETFTTTFAGSAYARCRGRGCVRQGRACGALQCVRRRARTRPHVPPAISSRSIESGRRAVVGEHDSPSATARGVLLHSLLHRLRSEAPRADAGELRIAVPDSLLGRGLRADRAAWRAARIVSGIDLRRSHLRAACRRPVCALHGRCVRSDGCAGAGIHGVDG